MSQWNETFIFLACREHKHEKKFLLIGYIPSSLDCFSITKKLQRVFSRVLHFAWQFSCKWNWRRAILPQTQICKLVEWNLIDTHRRDPFNQQFPEISVQTQWISSVQPEKFQKNWSTFWGGPLFWVRPVGILFEWIALSYRVTRSCSLWLDFFKCCFLLDAVNEKYSYISHTSLHFIYGWLRTCSPISSWLERIRNSLICSRIQ